MPDSYILQSPGGATQVDIASFTDAEGIDFGVRDLLQAAYVEGPHTDGALAFEQAVVRKMSFPLLLSASRTLPGLGLFDQEALLRKLARPGAVIDLKPQGATTAVRFDVLAGRLEFGYSVHENREGIRKAVLELDTKPYGYWPTQILIASAASVGLPGALALTGSVIGDAPALFELAIMPTGATNYSPGTWFPDMLAWSFAAVPSFVAYWPAASLASAIVGTLTADIYAAGSQAVRLHPSPTQAGWTTMLVATIASAREPAYRGRYRAYAFGRLTPSQAPWQFALDVTNLPGRGFASYAPIATLAAGVASGAPGAYAQPSPAHTLLDLGELTLPPGGSGLAQTLIMRLWGKPPASDLGIASPNVAIGGLYLLPASQAGVLARGLAQPSIGVPTDAMPTVGRLVLDANDRHAVIAVPGNNLATTVPLADALAFHFGPFPQAGPSAFQLDLLAGARRVSKSPTPSYPQIAGSYGPFVYYRHNETGGPTMVDTMGNRHASYAGTPSLGAVGIFDTALQVGSGYGIIPSVFAAATAYSLLGWARIGSTLTNQTFWANGNLAGGNQVLTRVMLVAANNLRFTVGSVNLRASGPFAPEPSYHLYAFTFNPASNAAAIWRDASLLASSGAHGGAYTATGVLGLGFGLAQPNIFSGHLDESMVFVGTAIGSDILNVLMDQRGGASYVNPPTGPVVRAAPHFAAVSVRMTPRFQFMKGL